MGREHEGKRGQTWETRVDMPNLHAPRREIVIADGPWEGEPVRVTFWDESPKKDVPAQSTPNRAARRALARKRKKEK